MFAGLELGKPDEHLTAHFDPKKVEKRRKEVTTRLTPVGDYIPEHIQRKTGRKADWQRIVAQMCTRCDWSGEQAAGSNSCPECTGCTKRTA